MGASYGVCHLVCRASIACMKKLLLTVLVLGIGGAGTLSFVAARYEQRIRPNTLIGPVPVGGLTVAEAAKKLRVWWFTERDRVLNLSVSGTSAKMAVKLGDIGFKLDDHASVAQAALEDFWDSASRSVGQGERTIQRLGLKVIPVPEKLAVIRTMVEDSSLKGRPARVQWRDGAIVRLTEENGTTVDESKFIETVAELIKSGEESLEVPTVDAPKTISDEDLAKITEIVSEFTTRFSAGNRSRSTNLEIASKSLDGVVIMPGQQFSFNGVLGKRSAKQGYKLAGIYKNGKHDVGLAGGICQVSTTLYNAALLANLEIKRRQNHSMPVPYVPIGRDATVDYGALDLVFENTTGSPIAVSSDYVPGKLTFRILGVKDPSLSVKIEASGSKSWAAGEKVVKDPTLLAGKRKVIDRGSTGRSVSTFRLVYKNGTLVKRESLGTSLYRAFPKTVALGTKKAAGTATAEEASPDQTGVQPPPPSQVP